MVEKAAKTLQARASKRIDAIALRRRLRFREEPVKYGDDPKSKLPSMYKRTTVEIRSPIIQYNVQEALALEMASAPVTTVKSKNSDKQSLCTMAERFCNGFYSRFEERTHADGKVADCQTAYFAGENKTFPRRDRWPEYPKQDEGESNEDYNKRTEDYKSHLGISECFFSDYIPIETVFLDDWNDPDIAVEVKKVNEQELMEKFGLSKGKDGDYYASKPGTDTEGGDDPLKQCTVYEYWNRQWRALLVKGSKKSTELDVWEHNFGLVPYFVAGAFETGETEEERKYIPLLASMYPEVEENNRLHTMRTNILNLTAFPRWYIVTAVSGQVVLDEKTNEPKVFDWDGPPNQLDPGQDIKYMALQMGFDFQSALKDSDDRLRQYALPPVASGKAPSSESAGWNTAMLRRFMVSLLDPLLQERAKQRARINRFLLWSIKNVIGEKVYVNADVLEGRKKVAEETIGIGPDDVEKLGDYDLTVRIDANIQMDKIPQEKHGMEEVIQGFKSMRAFMEEDRGLDSPEEEMEEIDIDKAAQMMWEANFSKLQAWLEATQAVEGVLGGQPAQQVVSQDEEFVSGIGKGSPGQPREPGVGMPPAPPMAGSPTYAPPPVGVV